jgi:hypothetical protein
MHGDRTALPEGRTSTSLPEPRCPLGYTVAETTRILRKSANTVYGWIDDGVRPARQIAGRGPYYIARHALAALIAADDGVIA